jgi:hypothetical protein
VHTHTHTSHARAHTHTQTHTHTHTRLNTYTHAHTTTTTTTTPITVGRHLAVCMGLHGKLGQRSPLRAIDAAVLYMILTQAVSIPMTAHSMLAALQKGVPEGRRGCR